MSSGPAAPVFHQHRYAHELDRLVPRGGAWLDIGAGHKIHGGWKGPSSEELAGRAGYLAGCDIGEDVLKHPHLHDRRVADAAHLPWADATFDLVSANMVVEHLSDPEAVFREVRRVLKPGGAFVFVTPNRNHPIIRTAAFLVPPALRRLYGIVFERRAAEDVFITEYRCNTVEEIARLSRATGLVPELIEAFVSEFPILPGPLGRIEARLGRVAARSVSGQRFGADILAVLRRPPVPA
ncbi:MAG TPA: class I SAM-dependent methyltransferase [Gemmatimonadaceae bacterium]|nr:class I SAM-dependent methyltransferase [Gemmatimonadaceae bacterium]